MVEKVKCKKISSDTQYYKSFAGLALGPPLIAILIKAAGANNFSNGTLTACYILLGIFTIFQWHKWYSSKKILLCDHAIIIKTYCTDKTIFIPASSIIEIEKSFSFVKRGNNQLYKMTFMYNDTKKKVSFFKASELYYVEDIYSYLRSTPTYKC